MRCYEIKAIGRSLYYKTAKDAKFAASESKWNDHPAERYTYMGVADRPAREVIR